MNMNQTTHTTRTGGRRLFGLMVALALLSGCTSTNTETATLSASPGQMDNKPFITGSEFKERIAGNTLIGRIPNFPGVGPIRFKIHYADNGTLSDFLTFERNGRTGRDTGVWRIEDDPQGIICYRYRKRLGGSENCFRFRVNGDGQFEQVSTTKPDDIITGRIAPGNQTR